MTIGVLGCMAERLKSKFLEEFNKLWIHGLVHLFGYKQKNNKDFYKIKDPKNLYSDTDPFPGLRLTNSLYGSIKIDKIN